MTQNRKTTVRQCNNNACDNVTTVIMSQGMEIIRTVTGMVLIAIGLFFGAYFIVECSAYDFKPGWSALGVAVCVFLAWILMSEDK